MDKDRKMEPQEAPLKNTDNAFVRVSDDGSPSIPDTASEQPGEDAAAEQQRKEALTERD